MKRYFAAALVSALVITLGCVVIPKQFDATIRVEIRHITEQADDILDYIEGKSDTLPGDGALRPQPTVWQQRVRYAFAPIQPVYAAELKTSSKNINKLVEKMKERLSEIAKLKKSGSIGEDNRGYVALRESEEMEDPEKKNAAQKLVSAENTDRKGLYREIVKENKDDKNVSLSAVEALYAAKRLERAKKDEIVQLPKSGKAFDELKESKLGKKLGDACKPEAWITIPE